MRIAVIVGIVALLCVPAVAREAGTSKLAKVPSAVLPPGDIRGELVESDGVTPHGNVAISLRDVKSGAEIKRTLADRNGEFILTGVPAGRYLVYVGNPGLGALLKVVEGAKAGTLTITVPKALTLPKPAALPKWWKEQPNSTKAIVGGGALLFLGGVYYLYEGHDDKTTGHILSPIKH